VRLKETVIAGLVGVGIVAGPVAPADTPAITYVPLVESCGQAKSVVQRTADLASSAACLWN
jgi:hypothetical protein